MEFVHQKVIEIFNSAHLYVSCRRMPVQIPTNQKGALSPGTSVVSLKFRRETHIRIYFYLILSCVHILTRVVEMAQLAERWSVLLSDSYCIRSGGLSSNPGDTVGFSFEWVSILTIIGFKVLLKTFIAQWWSKELTYRWVMVRVPPVLTIMRV